MNDHQDIQKIKFALDATFSNLKDDPWLAQKVLAKAKGEQKVKKKLSVGFVLLIVLALAVVTALAVGLTSYFGGFAKLEDTYGEYEQWPASAKVALVELMFENGVLTEQTAPEWAQAQTQPEKERAAENILTAYFSDLTYIDTYNAMTRELGPIERWSDEQRALYTSLLEQYGKLTDSWPVYQVPGSGDLSREQAISRAREVMLAKFSISPEALDALVVDAIFAEGGYHPFGAPKDEPFWIVEFGYGMAYRAYMTRTGEMIALAGPQTQMIPWGVSPMHEARIATPGEHDATREEAIANARNALTEIMNVSYEDVDAMDATAYFFYSGFYCHGTEPVWLVLWSSRGETMWQVLLGYDGSYMDAEPASKIFDQVLRNDPLLSDLCRQRYQELGFDNPHEIAGGFGGWSLETKAAFYEAIKPLVDEYVEAHPYFDPDGVSEWFWTRNAHGLPDERSIPRETALQIAEEAIRARFGASAPADDFNLKVFYFPTDPIRPEWGFYTRHFEVILNAYTGEVLRVDDQGQRDTDYIMDDFVAELLPQ